MRAPKTEDWLDSRVLNDIVKAVQSATQKAESREKILRVSSLPFCPLMHLIEHKESKPKTRNYESDFFFDIGTAEHLLFQRFSKTTPGVTLIGNWKCSKVLSTRKETNPPSETKTVCSHLYEFCSFKDLETKHTCPHGKNNCTPDNFEYEELTLIYNELSGHVDLLFKIKSKYYLVDIKTTGNYLFDMSKHALKSGYYPNTKYWHQVETYSVIMEKIHNIEIAGYAILYVSRERTSNKRKGHMLFVRGLDKKIRKQRLEFTDAQIENYKKSVSFVKAPTKKKLESIWNTRPCQTDRDYKELLDCKFFGSACPKYTDGSCSSGKIKKTIMKMYGD